MSWTQEHLAWLTETGEYIETVCGKKVPIFKFSYDITNNEIMLAWAKHFRNHYCSDAELEFLKPPGMTNSEYLLTLKLPSTEKPGPSIRAGDFAEILVADYLQFLRSYYVPRTRYDRKIITDESTKGSDVIAFKKFKDLPSDKDELLIYEVKAKLSEKNISNVLQKAIDDSIKDEVRIAESLNAIKQRLYDKRDESGVSLIARFQNSIDLPYKRNYGGAAVVTETSYCSDTFSSSTTINHPHANELEMIVISGKEVMSLVNALYEKAAYET